MDLVALDDAGLALLANHGLVKRARKESEQGTVPSFDESADGTVVGRARDGAVTTLPSGVTLKQTTCTCGAAMCRHRVALVMAYRAQHGEVVAGTCESASISDQALETTCGAAAIAKAKALTRASYLVTTRPGSTPIALLPSATVHFLVANALNLAKCDCTKGGCCEHVVLAVWAFRVAPSGGLVELGNAASDVLEPVLTQVRRVVDVISTQGMARETIAEPLGRARIAAENAGLVWVADVLGRAHPSI